MKDFILINILGLIGAGKSTLLNDNNIFPSQEYLKIHEPVDDNPWLKPFYEDMRANAYRMEYYLLHRRFSDLMSASQRGGAWVTDWGVESVFSKMLYEGGLIAPLDYDTYLLARSSMDNFMPQPHLIIWLDASPKCCLERIAGRGRECEKGVDLNYLNALKIEYEKHLDRKKLEGIPIHRVSWGTPAECERGREEILLALSMLNRFKKIELYACNRV